jgi:hypothetical protein
LSRNGARASSMAVGIRYDDNLKGVYNSTVSL